jgi:hypothetical protein
MILQIKVHSSIDESSLLIGSLFNVACLLDLLDIVKHAYSHSNFIIDNIKGGVYYENRGMQRVFIKENVYCITSISIKEVLKSSP